ncbi:regulatory protein RecX [Pinibacter soli]|uniref:Regulatory protein RecX n=1 Tax=Pinibacter soli TaxID=3044211 RepID=A0ABT6RCP0_9BACT|nr:regulatory protein RecX [Pinibacter soli]MDI3320160.1 regulatory protein RecX [Pinibacter soli]
MAFERTLTPEQALQKAKQYCAYQERSHQEVKDKLYSYGLHKPSVETMLSQLIEENYLNEERFAIAFAGGKFRMKHWGKVKIKYELKLKKVSDYCIKKALQSIEDEPYFETLHKLAEEKWKTLKGEKNIFVKMRKMHDYLLQKGYENEWVRDAVEKQRGK